MVRIRVASHTPIFIFLEYLDLSIQFGFVILFSAAFPLAPLFALLNNFLKIRTNAKELTKYSKRTVPKKTVDIGIWESIFWTLALLSVATNSLQIALTSQAITKLNYYFENDFSISGFVDYIHSSFPVDDFPVCSAPEISPDMDPFLNITITECSFRGFYQYDGDQFETTKTYWKDYMVKFVFTLVFNVSSHLDGWPFRIAYSVCYSVRNIHALCNILICNSRSSLAT